MGKIKRRKLTPKIERLFKNLEKHHPLKECNSSLDFRDIDVLNSWQLSEFKLKYNVYIRLGISCIVIADLDFKFKYLIYYVKNKRYIDCINILEDYI